MKMDIFALDAIAATLEGLEESIIYKILDRAQFARNLRAYEPGASGFPSSDSDSLFGLRMQYQETMDAVFGRFMVSEERPFTQNLPVSSRTLPEMQSFPLSDIAVIGQNQAILASYFSLLDVVCKEPDDGHYGSSVEHDVSALQAIARRIHYGSLYVSESKYRAQPALFQKLAAANDKDGLMAALTRSEVEARIIARVEAKTASIQEMINPLVRRRIDPEPVLAFYRNVIIPLTKEGECAYLLNRHPGMP